MGLQHAKAARLRRDVACVVGGIFLAWVLQAGRAPFKTVRGGVVDDEVGAATILARLGARREGRGVVDDGEILYVIPGGGPGADGDEGLPLWTKQRCDAALEAYAARPGPILALSAGSMNAPSPRRPGDGHVVFESAAMAAYLSDPARSVPVSRDDILCDVQSWDTVANARVARRVVDALLWLRRTGRGSRRRRSQLAVAVYVSDFHAGRVAAALRWALGAAPSVLDDVDLVVHPVPSPGLPWSASDAARRRDHEDRATAQIEANARLLPSRAALDAFLDLEAHDGYFKFTHGTYEPSRGPGWGA